MEVLILVAALAVMALIAMSQCAHHSSRRQETCHLPPARQDSANTARQLPHTVSTERAPETAAVAVTEREAVSGAAGPHR